MDMKRRFRVQGRLSGYATEFFDYTRSLGYTEWSAGWQLWVMARLSAWMESTGQSLSSLSEGQLAQFIVHHQASRYRQAIRRRRLAPLMDFFRARGLVPPAEEPLASPLDEFIEHYRRFLTEQRNLAPRTMEGHIKTAARFLMPWSSAVGEPFSLNALTAHDGTTFLLRETERLSSGAAKNVLQQLRSLLRFAYQVGALPQDLAVTLPPVASWHMTRLPPVVSPHDVEALIHSGDGAPAPRRRDYGVLLLLARLGLRASEVCRLTFEDLNWHAGEIVIVGKGRRVDGLPLPADVGAGIVDYLQHERPASQSRAVFLPFRAPHRGMSRGDVDYIVRKACRRSGLEPMGAHRLRHALATTLLHEGATLPMLGEILRHRDMESTAVYAKVDRDALQSVAQVWPEVDA